jgi:hypothetical protein
MDKLLTTIPAHFDGKEIQLDVPMTLKPNTRLLVTILDPTDDSDDLLTYAAMAASEKSFEQVWDNVEDAVYDDL